MDDIYETYELLSAGKLALWPVRHIRWIVNILQSFWDFDGPTLNSMDSVLLTGIM